MNSKTGEQKRPKVPESARLKARLKRLDRQIAQLEQRERYRKEKEEENLRYLLGRTVDTALILGELELARLAPLIDQHVPKPSDQDFIRQFFPSSGRTALPLQPRTLSPLESVLLEIYVHHPNYTEAERRRIYRRHYLWGVIAEGEGWHQAEWFRELLDKHIHISSDRRFLDLSPLAAT